MLCVNFATFTVAGGTLAATGTVYSADPCSDLDKVIMTAGEVAMLKEAARPSVFNLTLDEGGQIAGAVIAVWVVGWAIRTMIRLIRESHVSAVDND